MKLSSKTLEYLKWQKIVDAVESLTATPMGKARVRTWGFLQSEPEVVEELRSVAELRAIIDTAEAPELGGIEEIEVYLDRAGKEGILLPAELVQVADCLSGISRVAGFLRRQSSRSARLEALSSRVRDFKVAASQIFSVVDREGRIRDDASPELYGLRQKAFSLHQSIRQRLEDYIHEASSQEVLQEQFYTQREDRYVVPVRSERRSFVSGIVHDVSNSGATVFVEPDFLIPINNGLKWAQEAVHREEQRLLKELSVMVGGEARDILSSMQAVGDLDFLTAKALLAVAMDGSAVRVTSEPVLELYNARSPVLTLQHQDVIANDLVLGRRHQVLVLSGPNAGGKSVLLSMAGQCVLMVRSGLLPPASADSVVPLLKGLHALPGDLEDVENRLSTFTGHLQELNRVVKEAGVGHMVLVDEITVGTEPEQGAALGTAYLLALADSGCLSVIATHYEKLKAVALVDPRMENGAMGMDWSRMSQTYRMQTGAPGSSRTMDIARRAGTPEAILQQAEALMKGESAGHLEEALTRLRQQEEALGRMEQRLREQLAEAEQLKRRRALALDTLSKQSERVVRKRVEEASKEIEEALSEVGKLLHAATKAANDPVALQQTRKVLGQLAHRVEEKRDALADKEAEKLLVGQVAAGFQEGAEVWVKKFRRKATLVKLDNKEGMGHLAMGLMRMRLPLSDLTPLAAAATSEEPVRKPRMEAPPARTVDRRLDLRGMTVDEALDQVRDYLDQAILNYPGPLTIVHGHGTGKLKQAVRQLLTDCRYPITFRPGQREEGGDGITWVELKQ